MFNFKKRKKKKSPSSKAPKVKKKKKRSSNFLFLVHRRVTKEYMNKYGEWYNKWLDFQGTIKFP